MRHVLPVALAALCVGAAFAGSASAATTTACSMVSAAEYKQVLGKTVKLTPGEGSASCNVRSGSTWIIPNLNPYNAAYVKRMLGTMKPEADAGAVARHRRLRRRRDGWQRYQLRSEGKLVHLLPGQRGMTAAQAIKLAGIALTHI